MRDAVELVARRCHVAGRVQGVFFRGATQQKARELNCRGYARNLSDGRVEVLIVGERPAVEALTAWLWRGPPAAHVTDVQLEELGAEAIAAAPAGFETGRA
jgi:acylphosphatase